MKFGCHTVMEDHGMRIFESSVLKRIFGCRKLHNVYSSPNVNCVIKLGKMR
jgi:hypothetical protein